MNASTRPPRRLQKKGTMEEDDPVNLRDYQEIARRILPKMNYDFFSGGAEDEFTLRENVEAFQRIMPRILVDVSKIDMSTVLLGYHMSSPILVAPTGAQQLAHSDGFFCPRELATTRAAAACKTIMVLSTSSSYSIKEVASACDAIRFFQLYVNKKREITESLVKRAERNGYRAIVLTVDTPKLGRREADIRNKMIAPKLGNVEGLISVDTSAADGSKLEAYGSQFFDPSLSWKDIEWLKCITRLPIVVKGIITADDAVRAVECGVFGILVSNHGARQLDYVPCIISVLEEVVKAVSGAIPVLLDGGVGRGTDVFKALAVGAKAVLIGRPVVYGLAAKGEEGVGRVIKMLQDELELTMALADCPCLKHITRNHVVVNNHGRPRSLL